MSESLSEFFKNMPTETSSHLQCVFFCFEIVYSCTMNSYLHYVLICAAEECLAAALNIRVHKVSLSMTTTHVLRGAQLIDAHLIYLHPLVLCFLSWGSVHFKCHHHFVYST